jgi:serine protease Do
MRRGFLGLIPLLLSASVSFAADSPAREKVRELEQYTRRVIETAEPSIVAIVVSHSAKYPPLPAAVRERPGRLGDYIPTDLRHRAGPWVPPPTGPDKLDLSDPRNIPDNEYGSGVVLDDNGLILTTYHLIEGATKIYVRTTGGKGSYADVHAADARSDLAVLKLLHPPTGLRPVKFADVRTGAGANGGRPTVTRGQWVISLGYPLAAGFADGSPSASWGILSNVRRRAAGPGQEEQRNRPLYRHSILLQTDARVTLGCSGAALLNMDGELIGLTTPMAAVLGAETAGGFALPFDANYRRIVKTLQAGREVEYGFLGVSVLPTTNGPLDGGLRIEHVSPGTPAALAGLAGKADGVRGGADYILSIDGHPVREQDDLFLYISAALAGTKIKLEVAKKGAPAREVVVTLAKYAHGLPWIASVRPPSVFGLRVDYSSLLLQQDRRAAEQGMPEPGVLVRDLEPDSPAAAKFKPLGDNPRRWLITQVNGRPVRTPDEFYRAAAGQRSVKLRLVDPNPTARDREHTLQLP